MAKTGSVKVEILGDASGLKRATQEAEGHLSGFGDKLKGFGAGLIAGFGVDKIGGFANDAIQMASGIGESLNKNSVVFKEGADQIAAAAKGAAKTVGLSEAAYLELAGGVGTLGKAAGLTGDELGDFGNQIIARAGDIGSFNNAATSDVIEAWGAAMRGEAEPMRKFGVLLDDASLRAQALKMGLISNVKDALTPQQKALAANALIMAQTSDAAGDFAKTSDGLANKQKILKAQLDNVKTQIGSALLPVFAKVVSVLSDHLQPALATIGGAFRKVVDAVRFFIGVFRGTGAETGTLSDGMVDKIIYWGDYVRAVFDKVVGVIRSVIGWVVANWPAFQAAIQAGVQWIMDNVVPVVQAIVGYIIEQFGNLVGWVKDNWPAISEAIGHVMEAIKDITTTIIDWAVKFWQTFGEDILAFVKTAFEAIRRVVESVLGIVRGIIMTVVNLINGDWGKAWDSFKGILSSAWEGIKAILSGAVAAVGIILSAVWKPIEWGLDAAWGMVRNMWDTIVGFVGGLPGRIAGAASGMWDGIKNSFRSAINWIIGKWNSLDFTVGGGSFMGVDFPSFTLGTPNIPMLANGGIVTAPTIAMIGERGPEAVVPLRQGMGGMGGNTYNVNVSVGVGDKQAIATEVVGLIDVFERSNGRRFARAA